MRQQTEGGRSLPAVGPGGESQLRRESFDPAPLRQPVPGEATAGLPAWIIQLQKVYNIDKSR